MASSSSCRLAVWPLHVPPPTPHAPAGVESPPHHRLPPWPRQPRAPCPTLPPTPYYFYITVLPVKEKRNYFSTHKTERERERGGETERQRKTQRQRQRQRHRERERDRERERERCTATSPRWRRPASTSAIMCSPTPGLKPRLPPPSALGRKKLRVCHVQYH